ncbi:DoxX family protein [Streptomyces sp. NPDC093085]|uniref:DoxX family protein n=1 Tax=Streptomyces sp. NPDC093085 TaxID=3155068 RepID=UPI0034201FA0
MSVDTRTPRPGFDDQPPLSMLKVDCDPAQVIVNHASFRVKLATPQRPSPLRIPARSGGRGAPGPAGGLAGAGGLGAVGGAGGAGGAGGRPVGARAPRRRAPVVWSGKSAPGDPGATGLLQAVRNSALAPPPVRYEAGATQVIPRLGGGVADTETTLPTPVVGAPRTAADTAPGPYATTATPLLPPMRQAVGAYDLPERGGARGGPYDGGDGYGGHPGGAPENDLGYDPDGYDDREGPDGLDDFEGRVGPDGRPRERRSGNDAVRHAYYPGRRMNLGVVLLPLRVFLGFITIYAGMGKLCDPVYFDGGERGSMVKWLSSLHPWALAEPLRDFALSHPVGAGLSVAFLQIVVGVLTVLGLWQRLAASVGTLLSAALLLTVSWRTVPAYDAPDIIYLAAWSPLIIAGAPVYSVDGRLASDAWRTLGPRSELWELRRRVLRRGTIVATVVIGLTLLIGSMLGGAVRSSELVRVPGPGVDPVNQLPGMPLPRHRSGGPDGASGSPSSAGATSGTSSAPSATSSGSPSARQSAPVGGTTPSSGGASTGSAGTGPGAGQSQQQQQAPSQTQGTVQQPPQQAEQAPPPAPSSSGGAGDGSGGGGGGGGTGAADGGAPATSGTSGGGNRNPLGGLLG